MRINAKSFGFKELQKAIRKSEKTLNKAFTDLVKKVTQTALKEALRLAPFDTRNHKEGQPHYRDSIKSMLVSKFTGWLYSERPPKSQGSGHGYLAGLLEYGRHSYRPYAPRPHLQKAIEYAVRVHEKDIDEYFRGSFCKGLKDFGEEING